MNKQSFERIKSDLYAKFQEINEDQFINIAHNEMKPGYIVYKFENNKRKLHALTSNDIRNYNNILYLPVKVGVLNINDNTLFSEKMRVDNTELRFTNDYLAYWNLEKNFSGVIIYRYYHELKYIINEIIKEVAKLGLQIKKK